MTEAGAELNAHIHVEIMHLKVHKNRRGSMICYDKQGYESAIPNYSGCMKAAWKLVEKIKKVYSVNIDVAENRTNVEIKDYRSFPEHRADASQGAPKAPLAICLAVLKVKGLEGTSKI